ncbi:unnamed protein product [Calypogeia fissa]
MPLPISRVLVLPPALELWAGEIALCGGKGSRGLQPPAAVESGLSTTVAGQPAAAAPIENGSAILTADRFSSPDLQRHSSDYIGFGCILEGGSVTDMWNCPSQPGSDPSKLRSRTMLKLEKNFCFCWI